MNETHNDLNNIQAERRYKYTASRRNEIRFTKVNTKHIELVREELTHLGIVFEPALKIGKLVDALRLYHKEKQKAMYIRLHGFRKKINIKHNLGIKFELALKSRLLFDDALRLLLRKAKGHIICGINRLTSFRNRLEYYPYQNRVK